MADIPTNTIHCGDNLEIMRNMPDESVNLIYLDPPFFSCKDYDVIWEGDGDHSEIRSFKDTEWYRVQCPKCDREVVKADRFCSACGASLENAKVVSKNNIYAYIDWMIPRLNDIYRILAKDGSLYLHCDHHAVHYLKIEMDKIFGMNNLRSEIIWNSGSVSGFKSKKNGWVRQHDTILYYVKSKDFTFNKKYLPYKKEYLTMFKYVDEDGRKYRKRDKNRIQYLDNSKGMPISDIWEIYSLQTITQSKEKLGYPTQKPESLLERIIESSSNPGDIVFDPFCGCATTMAVAQKLGRKWIGIDVSWRACKVIADRLKIPIHSIKNMPLKNKDFAKMEPMEFQQWACDQMQANNVMPDGGADGGIDGIIKSNLHTTGCEGALLQVKHTKKDPKTNTVGVNTVKALFATMHDNRKKIGFIVALSFGKGAVDQVAKYKNEGSVEIILVLAEDIAEKGYFND